MKYQRKIKLENAADKATKWIGSLTSLFIHTFVFVVALVLPVLKVCTFEQMLLVLTTVVSLEAIYLSIFIQMSVNKNSQDIEAIQEDVGEIQEDVGEIQEDIDEIQEDIDEIQGDIEEIEGEELKSETLIEKKEADALQAIQKILQRLQKDIEVLKKKS